MVLDGRRDEVSFTCIKSVVGWESQLEEQGFFCAPWSNMVCFYMPDKVRLHMTSMFGGICLTYVSFKTRLLPPQMMVHGSEWTVAAGGT